MRIPKSFRGWRRACCSVFKEIRKRIANGHPAIPALIMLESMSKSFDYEGEAVQPLYNGWRNWESELNKVHKHWKGLPKTHSPYEADVLGYWEDLGIEFLFTSCEGMLADSNCLDEQVVQLLHNAIDERAG